MVELTLFIESEDDLPPEREKALGEWLDRSLARFRVRHRVLYIPPPGEGSAREGNGMVKVVFMAREGTLTPSTRERIGMAIEREFSGGVVCTEVEVIKAYDPQQMDIFAAAQRRGELPKLKESVQNAE